MQNINNFENNISIEEIIKIRNEKLKEQFGKYMKPNTLIRIKEEIKNSSEFNKIIKNCYDTSLKFILAQGTDDIDYDICINLAMNFWYDNLFETNETKGIRLKNDEYIKNLKTKTILQCKLRQLEKSFGKSNFYLSHIPLNFSINCLTNYLLLKIDEKLINKIPFTKPNEMFKINTMIVLLKNIKSILLLTETDNCGSAFALLRMLIETFCVYSAIGDNEQIANEYYKLMQYRIDYEVSGEYPNELSENLPRQVSLQNYLNYGWLDLIDNRHHKYKFSELLNYTQINDERLKAHFLDAYKYCCKYSHGNYLNHSIDAYDFIWVLGRVGIILIELAQEYIKLFNENVVYYNINLIEWLDSTIIESFKIYDKQNQTK